jgi:hypothetical protein
MAQTIQSFKQYKALKSGQVFSWTRVEGNIHFMTLIAY